MTEKYCERCSGKGVVEPQPCWTCGRVVDFGESCGCIAVKVTLQRCIRCEKYYKAEVRISEDAGIVDMTPTCDCWYGGTHDD